VGAASEPAEDTFKLTVRGPAGRSRSSTTSAQKGKGNVLTEVKSRSKLILLEEVSTEGSLVERRPADGTYQLAAAEAAPTEVETGAFTGDVAKRTGVAGLEAIDEVTMILAPDIMPMQAMGALSSDQALGVQLALVAHAERMANRVALLDPPPGLNAQEVFDWRRDTLKVDSSYAVLYYPWVKVIDPASRQPVFMPPSGVMGGIWGRNDDTRGVHKAPANEPVRGALDVQLQLTSEEQGLLNPAGINCIRVFPRGGVHGGPHARPDRPRVQVPQRAPSLQLRGELDPSWDPVGGLRRTTSSCGSACAAPSMASSPASGGMEPCSG
jgi:phage tail sheath protein FI